MASYHHGVDLINAAVSRPERGAREYSAPSNLGWPRWKLHVLDTINLVLHDIRSVSRSYSRATDISSQNHLHESRHGLWNSHWRVPFALWLGFPVPFIAVTCAPIGFIFATVCVVGSWGRFHLRHEEVLVKMQDQQAIISVNVMLDFVFPAYNDVFIRLSPSQPTWFALLFPVIKLVARNAVSSFCYYIEDF